jgi:tetratricopeptide (TPR) repeat protein
MLNRFIQLMIIILGIQSRVVYGLSCAEQFTNVFDTPCGKLYQKVYDITESDRTKDFFEEWKKYEKQCSETGEYQIYLAGELQAIGKHEETQSILKKIIAEKSGKYDARAAYLILLQSLKSQKDFLKNEDKIREAKEAAMQAVILYPYWYRGHLAYGEILVYQNKFIEGSKYLEHSIELQPNHAEPYAFLTIVYHLHFGNAKKAIEMYKKGLAMKQERLLFSIPHATLSVVKCAMNQKDYKTAVWVMVRQKELYPEFAKEDWYHDLEKTMKDYFKKKGITEVFTPEEKEALIYEEVDILKILGY